VHYVLMLMTLCSGPQSSKPVAMLVSDVAIILTGMCPSNACHMITKNHSSVRLCFLIEFVGLTY
jgi:hypothetical protein